MHQAAFVGDIQAATRLLVAVAEVDGTIATGETAPFVSAAAAQREMLELLLARGARLNRRGP